MSRRLRCISLAGLILGLAVSTPVMTASAMEWSTRVDVQKNIVVYSATGPVVPDDLERLAAVVAKSKQANAATPGIGKRTLSGLWAWVAEKENRPLVYLNSNGGNVVGGVRLGSYIREQGFDTIVDADAQCHSACTMAFLGGVSRTVLGVFGIHAMSFDASAPSAKGKAVGDLLDGFQSLSSIFIVYTREMVGSSDMADAALRFGSKGIYLVNDPELRDWGVITVAARPTQQVPGSSYTTIDCKNVIVPIGVRNAVCFDLGFARSDARIAAALSKLKLSVDPKVIDAEQMRWQNYRDGCARKANPTDPSALLGRQVGSDGTFGASVQTTPGQRAVEACVREAYQVRLSELESLAAYYAIRNGKTIAIQWHGQTK